jgi:hypothetical protein
MKKGPIKKITKGRRRQQQQKKVACGTMLVNRGSEAG